MIVDHFEGLSRMILLDHFAHSGCYDNRTSGGKGQWVLGNSLKPHEARAKSSYAVPYHTVDPQEFRPHLVNLFVHAAKQSDVPAVKAHTLLSNLRKRLPRDPATKWGELHCVIMRFSTWQEKIITPSMDTAGWWGHLKGEWKKFHEDLTNVSYVVFDSNVPKNMVLGLSLPEYVGVLTYSDWGWRVGALVDQNHIRAVKIK